MKSIKAYMPVLLLVWVTLMSGTLAAQNSRKSFDGPVGQWNPCSPPFTSAVVAPNGTTNIVYHQNGGHRAAHLRYDGVGQEFDVVQGAFQATGVTYQVSLEAEAQLDGNASSYDVPYHAVFAGPATFTMTGMLRIVMTDGQPAYDNILSAQTTCSN